MVKIRDLLRKEFCLVTINSIINQAHNLPKDLFVFVAYLHKGLYYEIEYDEKSGLPQLCFNNKEGETYTVESFIQLLHGIKNKYGNIKVYVNDGGTILVKRFDNLGKPYVYLTSSYNDIGYL